MGLQGNKRTLCIELNAEEINVVEGKYSKKGVIVNKSFSIPMPKELYIDGEIQDMDQFAYVLNNGLVENNAFKGETYGIVNSSQIILREISMPRVEDSQIDSVLSYQLEDYLPVDPDNYVVKYINLGNIVDEGIEKLSLLLIGVPRIIVESHLNLFKNVGLKPVVLDFSGNAINKLIYFGEKINNFYDNQGTVACINVGYESTSLTITQKGIIKVSRVNEIGKRNIIKELQNRFGGITEQEALDKIDEIDDINEEYNPISQEYIIAESLKYSLNQILESIEMIFRYYRTRDVGNNIDLVILHGNMFDINGIETLLTNYFETTCIRLDSLSKVKFNGNLSKYSNAIGGLIRIDEVKK